MIVKALLLVILIVAYGQWYKRRTGNLPEWKYFKPYSVSWWMAVIPGVVGILISGEPLTGWTELVDTLQTASGGADPQMLIYGSAAGIGLVGRS